LGKTCSNRAVPTAVKQPLAEAENAASTVSNIRFDLVTDTGADMKVTDILRVKGNTLFTVPPDQPLMQAVNTMAELDIGSLPVMEHGDLVGMLTFREVINAVVANGGTIGTRSVRSVMDDAPLTCTPETEIDEVRRMMLMRHARYMPVLEKRTLMGVISFYDVAKTVVDAQDFENRMLKAYIRDWPAEGTPVPGA
jgi:CBS domain-containing protein